MTGVVFDEGAAKRLEEIYGARDVRRRRALVREAVGAQPGDRVIDVGCGPGFYVSELLDEVGPDGAVLGVDAAEAMLGVAAKRCEGRGNVAFEQADATSLPAADSSFDRALSVQVMEYVPDVSAALAEVHRVLRPGGRAVIWDVDWRTFSWHATDADRMERAQRAWDNHVAHPALPQRLTALLTAAGFEDVAMEGHVFATNRIDPEAYLCVTMPLIVAFVATQPEFGAEEAKALEREQHELAERGEFYGAVTQFCFSARKPGVSSAPPAPRPTG